MFASQPCKNGASCLPLDRAPSAGNSRFACKCRPGYQGIHCEQPVRSCLDYSNPENKPNIYHALDSDDDVFPIFCDFRTYSKFKIFNLIQSYKWNQKELFNDSLIKKKQIAIDDPTTTPYRLSPLRMEKIRKHFSQWRVEFGKTANRDCWKGLTLIFVRRIAHHAQFVQLGPFQMGQPKQPDHVFLR